VCLLWCLQ
jgi:hypothetical protein